MDIKDILRKAIQEVLQEICDQGVLKLPEAAQLPEIQLEVPPRKELGDFSTNIAMQASRVFRCNPRMIAQAIVDKL